MQENELARILNVLKSLIEKTRNTWFLLNVLLFGFVLKTYIGVYYAINNIN